MGSNGYGFAGKRYSSSSHKDVIVDGCVTCHMSLPEGRYAFSPSLGGHSFNVVAEVHEAGKLNNSGCIQRTDPPMFKPGAPATFHGLGSGWAKSKQGGWTEAEVGALYNYGIIIEDRSRGVHDAAYTIQLLCDSLKALDPRLDDSLRPR